MKLWIINNTKFGYKNNSKEWSQNMFNYFENHFIPFITKHAKVGDRLIHIGNIFNSSENVNIELLLSVRDLFIKLNKILDVEILNGYNERSGISTMFKSIVINDPINDFGVQYIPYGSNVLENISNQQVVILNSRIDTQLLKKYPDTLFICGYHDDRKEDDNVISVGAPYQFDKTSVDKGFYVVDPITKKYQFVKNNYSPKYNTITITDISQIDDIDTDFVDNNHVSVVIDKSLIDDKKIKIDVLLSKYNFKSISYTNDEEKVELVDSTSFDMEELIREKIKNSDNPELISEFENIMSIYKEKY